VNRFSRCAVKLCLLASAGPLYALPSLLALTALLRRAASLVGPGSAAALRSLAGSAGGSLAGFAGGSLAGFAGGDGRAATRLAIHWNLG